MSAAIYFHPEAYTTNGPKLMGRNAAGESFLRGYLLHGTNHIVWLQVQKTEHAASFEKVLETEGGHQPKAPEQGVSRGPAAFVGRPPLESEYFAVSCGGAPIEIVRQYMEDQRK